MKVAAYGCRADEWEPFAQLAAQYGHEVVCHTEPLLPETLSLADGMQGVSLLGGAPIGQEVLSGLKERGISYLAVRSVGFNHIDLTAARQMGVRVSNAHYSPHSVADFTVMLILMLLRKAGPILRRMGERQYGVLGVRGRELHNCTVGVVGAGRIGRTVIQDLTGFGCPVVYYDPFAPAALPGGAQGVSLEELLRISDVITLHAPATPENDHLIDAAAIAAMKPGACVVNAARGSLVDTAALLEGLKSGKLGGAALDCFEEEGALFGGEAEGLCIQELRTLPNVLVTPHIAFYTDQAVEDMVRCSLESLQFFEQGMENPYEVAAE